MVKIENITEESFRAFGSVIEFPKEEESDFYIVEREPQEPWRLAVFRYTNKILQTLECHPASKESFEPIRGTTILVVAEPDSPEAYRAFLLDKPVCLKKNIWHQVLAVTEEAQSKITENLEVKSAFHELSQAVSLGLV